MEKFEDVKPIRRPSSKGLGIRFLAAPLLAFLVLYNLVPSVHNSVQSFFDLIPGFEDISQTIAVTSQGTFVGKVIDNRDHPIPVEAWLGIPYAQPPTGNLRFAKPVPVPDSNETIQATEYSLRYVDNCRRSCRISRLTFRQMSWQATSSHSRNTMARIKRRLSYTERIPMERDFRQC